VTAKSELWFRNPHNYVRELAECGYGNIIWDYGSIVKRKLDPVRHAELFFGQSIPWRLLVVGEQGCADYRPGSEFGVPVAVYPVWRYGEDMEILTEIIQRPVGEDETYTGDMELLPSERPIPGQEHRVVIIDAPSAGHIHGRHFFKQLKEMQEEYPECIIHVHGLYSFRYMFAMGYGSVDFEPRTSAQKGKVFLSSGRDMRYEEVAKHPKWATAVGMKPIDLAIPRNRCIFNIKSSLWARDNYAELIKFRTQSVNDLTDEEIDAPKAEFKQRERREPLFGDVVIQEGDKVSCNTCSLNGNCTFYREGAVCSLPSSETSRLAAMFKTRDSGQIIDAMGILLGKQAERLEHGLEDEKEFGELSPEVSKIMGSLLSNAPKLAKLVDPSLNKPALALQINNMNGGAGMVAGASPKQIVAAVTRELIEAGIPIESITPEMITNVLNRASAAAAPRQIANTASVQDGEIVE
jgi:hypothetical protein